MHQLRRLRTTILRPLIRGKEAGLSKVLHGRIRTTFPTGHGLKSTPTHLWRTIRFLTDRIPLTHLFEDPNHLPTMICVKAPTGLTGKKVTAKVDSLKNLTHLCRSKTTLHTSILRRPSLRLSKSTLLCMRQLRMHSSNISNKHNLNTIRALIHQPHRRLKHPRPQSLLCHDIHTPERWLVPSRPMRAVSWTSTANLGFSSFSRTYQFALRVRDWNILDPYLTAAFCPICVKNSIRCIPFGTDHLFCLGHAGTFRLRLRLMNVGA